jgi:hypothetical protein
MYIFPAAIERNKKIFASFRRLSAGKTQENLRHKHQLFDKASAQKTTKYF